MGNMGTKLLNERSDETDIADVWTELDGGSEGTEYEG